jgi:hypothetical protein
MEIGPGTIHPLKPSCFLQGMLMNTREVISRCSTAAEEFDHHERRSDGLQVIGG